MRITRGILASMAGFVAGIGAAFASVTAVRAATREGDLVWKVVPPGRVAAWVLAAAHGAPLRIRTVAGLTARSAALPGGRSQVGVTLSVLLVPISLLLIVGTIVALLARRADARSPAELVRLAALTAITHGTLLALAARLGAVDFSFHGTLAPQLGLGTATGRVALHLGPSPLVAFLTGAAWGGAFAVAGALSAPAMRAYLSTDSRVVLRAWLRGLGGASGLISAGLAIGGLVAIVSGRAPTVALTAVGAFLLWANVVSAGIVLAHGASAAVSLDAGPFTGWQRIDFLHYGVAASPAPWVLWVGGLCPLVAGVVAARYAARRCGLSAGTFGMRFGVLWGVTLAVLSLLLRVRVLSSFSVADLRLGGGGAAIDPLAALVLGTAWGTVTAAGGIVLARGRARAPRPEPAG